MSLIDDAVLLKMAEEEILGEAKRAAARHAIAGVSGWRPCLKPNKTFLANTLLQTMASNRILDRRKGSTTSRSKKTERKLLRRGAVEKNSNFLYKKPKEIKNKSLLDTSKKKYEVKKNKSVNKQSVTTMENTKKHDAVNIKVKKA